MTQTQALDAARTLFPKQNIVSVVRYTQPEWRDGGSKGWRVTMAGDTIHWLTRRLHHEKQVCCKEQHAKAKFKRPEVVKR